MGKSKLPIDDELELKNVGFPNYDTLTNAEKKILLIPLVDEIRAFYIDPENRRKYNEWLGIQKSKNTA